MRLLVGITWVVVLAVLFAACTRSPAPSDRGAQAPVPSPQTISEPATTARFSGLDRLDSATLEGFVAQLDRAFRGKDATFLRRHIASDALIVVEQGGRVTSVDKKQYLESLTTSWSKIQDYTYDRSEPTIAIQDDLANIHFVVVESGRVLGRKIEARIDTLLELKLDQGQVLITYVKGRSEMKLM